MVADVHDLHVWTHTSELDVFLAAHVGVIAGCRLRVDPIAGHLERMVGHSPTTRIHV